MSHGETGKTTRTQILPDSFVFVAPEQPHRLNWSEDGEVLHLWVAKETLQEISEQTKCPIPVSKLGDRPDRGIFEIGRMLMDEFNATGGLTPTIANHASCLMISHVLRISGLIPRKLPSGILSRNQLLPAIDFLSECPERDVTLSELARLCHSSIFHFARSFTARVGCAPFAFQRTSRLRNARRLLCCTELSIEMIAASVGFQNATHFSRLFRRETGHSPREYRRLRTSKE